jgi:hypothetical protein
MNATDTASLIFFEGSLATNLYQSDVLKVIIRPHRVFLLLQPLASATG